MRLNPISKRADIAHKHVYLILHAYSDAFDRGLRVFPLYDVAFDDRHIKKQELAFIKKLAGRLASATAHTLMLHMMAYQRPLASSRPLQARILLVSVGVVSYHIM